MKVDAKMRRDFKAAYNSIMQRMDFEMDGMEIVYPATTDEIIAEGHALHHCVGGYEDRVAKKECIILFLRKSKEESKPFYTIEVRGREVIQVRGMKNDLPTPKVERFMKQWEKEVLAAPRVLRKKLGHKYILAYILVNTVDEFKGMNPRDVVQYIEGEPLIGVAPVEPGMTNSPKEDSAKKGQRVGFNSENAEINEGLVRFDIVFYVRMKDGLSQMIINVEAQKDEPAGYDVLNRAVFYVSRLVSSQKERDFVNTNYNDIRRVFSIWVCMNQNENSMGYVHLQQIADVAEKSVEEIKAVIEKRYPVLA